MRQRTWRALSAAVAALALAFTACGGDSDGGNSSAPCPALTPVSDLSLIPEDIPIAEHSTVTIASKSRGYVGVVGISDKKIVELYPIFSRALLDARYDIRSGDNEGFEAEIFFSRGRTIGSYRMREGPCAGQVTVKLLYRAPRAKGAA